MLEGKVIWDEWDGRLNVKRFEEGGITKDFDLLAGLQDEQRRGVVVWVAYSKDDVLCRKEESAATYRLGDIVDLIPDRFDWKLSASQLVELPGELKHEGYRWVHLFAWSPDGSS